MKAQNYDRFGNVSKIIENYEYWTLLSNKKCDGLLKVNYCATGHDNCSFDNLWKLITDFGLSKLAHDNTTLKTFCGTRMYMPPQILKTKCSKSPYTSAVDAWSLGIIICYLLTGLHSFSQTHLSKMDFRKGKFYL